MSSSIDILLEHDDFLIVDKPCNVAMHRGDESTVSILNLLASFGFKEKLFLVHRLDTPTSGCLLIAKHKESAGILSDLFAKRKIEKYYLAISDKRPKKKQGSIMGDMQKARGGSYKLSKSCNQPAITHFVSSAILNKGKRLYLCKPITGKTHQIRVALKALSAPIMGDDRYGGSPSDRLYLHSFGMRFLYQSKQITLFHPPCEGIHFDSLELPQSWLEPHHLMWPTAKLTNVSYISKDAE
uniref:TIGR01621 family pseudouridine synthase n=1 Tax=Ningiella ruwaisensis TaxID=2364274 RepID=UPI0019D54079|nr:TIGR01621 family pseudouridine synthase [Ningiella ruwaisensis]